MEAYSITERIRTWRDAGGNGSKKFVTTCFNLQKNPQKTHLLYFEREITIEEIAYSDHTTKKYSVALKMLSKSMYNQEDVPNALKVQVLNAEKCHNIMLLCCRSLLFIVKGSKSSALKILLKKEK